MRWYYDSRGQYQGSSNGMAWELAKQAVRLCVFMIVLAWPFELHVGYWAWAIEVPYLFAIAAAYGCYRSWKENR